MTSRDHYTQVAPLLVVLWACLLPAAFAQAPAPAQRAYDALRARNYDAAIAAFQEAIAAAPAHSGLRKDLAYTYLKAGETEAARDQFAEAMRLDPPTNTSLSNTRSCASKRASRPRRAASSIACARPPRGPRVQPPPRPSRISTSRLRRVSPAGAPSSAQSPQDFSARVELAHLSEQRDELEPAAGQYLAAWRIRPAERELLLDDGRVWRRSGATNRPRAALLAASRGSRPRVAEQARELLPAERPRPPSTAVPSSSTPPIWNLRRRTGAPLSRVRTEGRRRARTARHRRARAAGPRNRRHSSAS